MILKIYFIIEEILHILSFPFLLFLSIFKPLRKEIMPRLFPHSFEGKRVILHGASIGEVKSLFPIGREIKKMGIPLLFTSATINGVNTALKENFPAQLFPLEFSLSHFFFFRKLKPVAIIVSERDYWMRFLKGVKKRGGKVIVINFSIARKNFFKKIFISLLKEMNPQFFARNEEDRDFLLNLGFKEIKILPSLKSLSLSPSEEKLERDIFLAVSVHEEEFTFIKYAFEKLREKTCVKLVIAPRYMKRLNHLKEIFSGFNVSLYSERKENFDVLIVNTYGVLNSFYPRARAVFVGGSIAKRGCHDLLEPSSFKSPVLFGPNFWNQKDVAELLIKENGGRVVKTPEEMVSVLMSIFKGDESAPSGERAYSVYEKIKASARAGLEEIIKEVSCLS